MRKVPCCVAEREPPDHVMVTMKLPTAAAGTVLTFPMVQTCVVGSLRWIEGPKSKYPAPTVTIN